MHLRPFSLGLFCFAASAVALLADIERTVSRTFEVRPGGTLTLDTFSGPIEVRTHARPQVVVELKQKIDASSDEAADQKLTNLALTIEAKGNGVAAVAEWRGAKMQGWWRGRHPVKLEWTVTVPERFDVDLDTSGGAIRVADLTGRVKADTSGGSITIGTVAGDVDADTSGGSIRLAAATGAVRLDTSGGSIDVGRVGGSASLDTSGGSIAVDEAVGPVQADTSGGGIRVRFVGPVRGASSLNTSGGGITATFDPGAAFDLAASTSGGGVRCDLPIDATRRERGELRGRVNGGGPTVRLDTSGGGIRVEAAASTTVAVER